MPQPRYISIEGPIGVGKTSLAKRLAEDFKAQLVMEEPAANPFLGDFYQDREKHAFACQVFFMLARYQQQIALKQGDLFNQGQAIICDYSFAKDWIFARMNLSEEEFNLYRKIYALLGEQISRPDLIIYLQSEPNLLRKHVKKRKAEYEKNLKADYLEEVMEAYNQFFFSYNDSPLLVVNCSQIDFVNNEEHYKSLVREIVTAGDKRGSRHYVAIEG